VSAVATALVAGCSGASVDASGERGAGEAVTPVASCAADAAATAAVRTATDVPYVERGGRALRLDVAWPEGGAPAPLVVLLHGGGWSAGSRASLHDEMRAWARRGYAAATVEYRLTQAPRDVFPAAPADVACAVRFLRARAASYGIDPARVAAAGFSAGAHLASLLGTAAGAADIEAACGDAAVDAASARLQAVVSYAGPQDLRVNGPYTQEQAQLVTNFLGAFPGDAPQRAALASPITHVSAGDPPFLLVHGARDALVPVEHSRRMAGALQRVGTPATLLELRGLGHAFVGLATSDDARVRCTSEAFLARWLSRGAGA
jgi:acetyl esterase/lipase